MIGAEKPEYSRPFYSFLRKRRRRFYVGDLNRLEAAGRSRTRGHIFPAQSNPSILVLQFLIFLNSAADKNNVMSSIHGTEINIFMEFHNPLRVIFPLHNFYTFTILIWENYEL